MKAKVTVKLSLCAIALALAGCAALNMGWYKPGVTAQEFNQDKFDCMRGSQMQVSTSNVNGRGSTYYGGGNVTCNTYGSTTNCSGGGGYSQPGYVSGSSASYVTTNMPLFQACMQARGYVWTSQAQVEQYEQRQNEATPEQTDSTDEQGSSDAGATTDQSDSVPAAGVQEEQPGDHFGEQVASVQDVFWRTCGSDPTAQPVSVCGPLGTLAARAHFLMTQVKAGVLSRKDAAQQLKEARDAAAAQ